jgi:hypothetical protein
MNTADKINLQEWWLEELRLLIQKVEAKEKKRYENAKKKCASMLEDYSSVDDINEAYGVGNITARKRDMLLDLWERAEVNLDELYQAKLEMLQDFRNEAKQIIDNLHREES